MRYDGVAKIIENDERLMQHLRQSSPHMVEHYERNGWKNYLFYLENGHVEIRESLDLVEEFDL